MKHEEFKPKINIISTLPRSLSTILYRSLLENSNCICLFECFMHYNVKDNYLNLKNLYKDENDLYKIIENTIEAATKSGKDVLIKDFGCDMNFHCDFFDKLVKNYEVKFLYLIRHPKPCLNSFIKGLENDKDIQELKLEDKTFDYYKACWEFYLKFKGEIFFTENLLEFPETTMKQILEYLGWEFSNKYLEFEKLVDKGIPDDLKLIPLIWYDSALHSTKIIPKKTDLEFEIKDELLLKIIDQAMPTYEKFINESKKVLN